MIAVTGGGGGKDDQLGAINLITRPNGRRPPPGAHGEKRLPEPPVSQGARPNNALPRSTTCARCRGGKGGFAADYYGIFYHGIASTHIDALCHTWDEEAMWNGRDPKKEITFDGATFGAVEHWARASSREESSSTCRATAGCRR